MNRAHAVQTEQISDRELLFSALDRHPLQGVDAEWKLKDGNLTYELEVKVDLREVEPRNMCLRLTFELCWYEGWEGDPGNDPTVACVRDIFNLSALIEYLSLTSDWDFLNTLILGTKEERVEIVKHALTSAFIMKNVRVVMRNGKIDLISFDGFKHMSLTGT